MAKNKYTGTVALNQPSPKYGDAVDFNVTTTAPASGVRLTYSQNGQIVGVSSTIYHYSTAYTTEKYGLSSPIWSGGAADVVADLVSTTGAKIASTKFLVVA